MLASLTLSSGMLLPTVEGRLVAAAPPYCAWGQYSWRWGNAALDPVLVTLREQSGLLTAFLISEEGAERLQAWLGLPLPLSSAASPAGESCDTVLSEHKAPPCGHMLLWLRLLWGLWKSGRLPSVDPHSCLAPSKEHAPEPALLSRRVSCPVMSNLSPESMLAALC